MPHRTPSPPATPFVPRWRRASGALLLILGLAAIGWALGFAREGRGLALHASQALPGTQGMPETQGMPGKLGTGGEERPGRSAQSTGEAGEAPSGEAGNEAEATPPGSEADRDGSSGPDADRRDAASGSRGEGDATGGDGGEAGGGEPSAPGEGSEAPGEVPGGETEAPRGQKVSPVPERGRGAMPTERTRAAVREAIADFLHESPRRSRRGALALRRGGEAIVPQIRYWLDRVRFEAHRVEKLLREILEEAGRPPGEAPVFRSMPVADFFHVKLLEARDLTRRGRYREARRIGEALLALDPQSPVAWELRRLVRQARERVLAEELEPRIDVERRIVEVGEEPKLTFRLINRSERRARIRLDRGVLGRLRIRVDTRALDGSQRSFDRMAILRTRRSTREIELAPGELWKQPVPLPPLARAVDLGGMVARVRITGTFRPAKWTFAGEEKEDNLSVRIVPGELWIVPPSHRRGPESPVERLVAALFFGKVEGFLVGGQLAVWAGRRDPVLNERAVGVLIGHIDELDDVRWKLARLFLMEATGHDFRTRDEWSRWWERLREGRGPPPSVPRAGEAPAAEVLPSRRR